MISSPAPLIPHHRRTASVLNPSHPLGLRRKATSTRGVSSDLVRRRLLRVTASSSPSCPADPADPSPPPGDPPFSGTWSTPLLPLNHWSVTIPAVRVYKSLLPYFYFSWHRGRRLQRHQIRHLLLLPPSLQRHFRYVPVFFIPFLLHTTRSASLGLRFLLPGVDA